MEISIPFQNASVECAVDICNKCIVVELVCWCARNICNTFQVLTEYRKRFGIEPLRRCGACMDGLATKLKRCAKCPEVYCSRECQAYAWDEGHKNLCNYSLDETNSG